MSHQQSHIRRRDDQFAERTVTRIWDEEPAPSNPYLAEKCRCHGYDILELAGKRSFVEVFFLLFRGELPSPEQAELLETLMIAFINPGPRHPAARAAMNGAVGRTNSAHLLPIGLSVLSGAHLGGEEVVAAMRFLQNHLNADPGDVAADLLKTPRPSEGDWHIAPGFGSRFGSIDPFPRQIAEMLADLPGSGEVIRWGLDFVQAMTSHEIGWLSTGVAATVFCDLGFHRLAGAGLFQLLCAPGVLAHGLELVNKPITAMPFLDEEHYVIGPEARKS